PGELLQQLARHLPRPVLTPRRAWQAASQIVPWAEAVGKICTEYAALYPPGIPLIIPGEEITPAVVETMLWAQCCGINIHGLSDPTARTVRVVVNS
ncbi:MAG: aminotransferase class I/II-fold pyridoxal phosphate-dependent enzyme, partial [Desulfurispora sp.]|uniref:Orn/Lys/Arg family decarboxylase n=1 Tax=Desulfurispora sp. TaxID=3014275 RepID=UPI00404AF780